MIRLPTVHLSAPHPRASARLALVACLALVAGLLLVPSPARAAPAAPWSPQAGVTFNDPLGGRGAQRRILRTLVKSIDRAPAGSAIRFASWNIRGATIVDALVRAHRRGVGVRVVLDRGNAGPRNPNLQVDRLERALGRHGNAARPGYLQSGVRRCIGSCRGTSGIPHSKFVALSQSGAARRVVVNTSANATDLAADSQWNDAYTLVGDRVLYEAFTAVFDQMWLDRPVDQGYVVARSGGTTAMFYPYAGARTGVDPVVRELRRVRCRGARNQPGGRTRIRIAMTSWHGARGTTIARKVRRLATRGCDVRIVYAVAGNEVLRILRRGGPRPVPVRQVVQDPDRDGVYDRYLHAKVLTIKGHYRQQRRATVTLNGSANFSPAVLASDEVVLRISAGSVLRRYNAWIDRLYRHPKL